MRRKVEANVIAVARRSSADVLQGRGYRPSIETEEGGEDPTAV